MNKSKIINFEYTNYKGEKRMRRVVPHSLEFKETKYHKGQQWILEGLDVEKDEVRQFALCDIEGIVAESKITLSYDVIHCCECGYPLDKVATELYGVSNYEWMYEEIQCPQCKSNLVVEYEEGADEDGDYWENWWTSKIEKGE